MEQQLLAKCEQSLNQTTANFSNYTLFRQALSLARSLIVNPSTSGQTISSIFETLTRSVQPSHNSLVLHHTLSLLSDLAAHRPHLSHSIFTAVHSFSLEPNNSSRTVTDALSVLISISERNQTLIPTISELSEGLFISLCFRPCVSVRHWLLLNAERFCVRPSLLLTVLLGFTKDPYPYVRRVALVGLVGLCKCIVVEDCGMIEGCYCRAVELLYDMDDCVRCSAVLAVSEWGRSLVASIQDRSRSDCSDALFVQICSMIRDMNVEVRVEAFDALGKVGMVSEDILLQTLTKKVLPMIKEKKYPGQFTIKQFELPASCAAGAFLHGLEDEFYEVRRSACCSLRTLTILSADFAGEALNLLMNVLNDDSLVVRLQALETMHHMAIFDLLRVQEAHMHMFLGTLSDTSTSIRSAARKILRLTKLHKLAMFKLFINSLIENLEMYPQDEADVFSAIFNIGRNHGNFTVGTIKEVSPEIEPSSEGKLGFDSAKSATLLVLAISAPLSHEQHMCHIPPKIFSYASTLLGRISRGLADVMDQNTLLAYLSHCSRSTVVSASEFFKGEVPVFPVLKDDLPNSTCIQITSPVEMHLQQKGDGISEIHSQRTWELRKEATLCVDYQMAEVHDEEKNSVKLIIEKVNGIWPLIQFGCMGEVLRTLRSWKEELVAFTTDSQLSAGGLFFTLQYLRVVKLFGKVWVHLMSPRKLRSNKMVESGLILEKLDKSLREMRNRFIGLSKEEELHVLELVLATYILRLSNDEDCCHRSTMKKLYSTISRVAFVLKEGAIEPSSFVMELNKSLPDIVSSVDGPSYSPFMLQKLLEFFSLKQFLFCGELKHVRAELKVQDNNCENRLPFVSGLPVGIPFHITLYNTLTEDRLWLRMTVDKGLTQFVFLDLKHFGGWDEIRKFTFIAPFYRTPKASSFTLRVCIGMECLSEGVHLFRDCRGPKHELAYLCKEKEIYLSMVVK